MPPNRRLRGSSAQTLVAKREMFRLISNTATRRPKLVVAVALITSLVTLVCAAGVTNQMSSWGFDAPGSEQLRALDRYYEATGYDPTGSVVALVETKGDVTGRQGRRLAAKARRLIESEKAVDKVFVPFGPRAVPGLISKDGHAAVVVGYL